MFNFLKIVASFIAISGVGFLLARWADSLVSPQSLSVPERLTAAEEGSRSQVDAMPEVAPPSRSLVSAFLDPKGETGVLKKKLNALDLAELEELYIEALSFDLEDRRAFETAGLALEAIAMRDPGLAVGLLYALSPAEKARLATALSNGWAQHDAASAWGWIATAWVDVEGGFIDRRLQNRMFREALDVVLGDHGDVQLAADLASRTVEPELRAELADLIAYHVVSENPEQALESLDFESDAFVDSAIMDAIIDEWAQRDSRGAMTWTLENEGEVSGKGARLVAKNLLLNGVYEDLKTFYSGLGSAGKRDAVASESSRLLARREPDVSIDWLAAIESIPSRYRAFSDSLYEIGNDDFDRSIRYAELAYGVANLDRETVLYEALESWVLVDSEKVKEYLDFDDKMESSGRLAPIRESVN